MARLWLDYMGHVARSPSTESNPRRRPPRGQRVKPLLAGPADSIVCCMSLTVLRRQHRGHERQRREFIASEVLVAALGQATLDSPACAPPFPTPFSPGRENLAVQRQMLALAVMTVRIKPCREEAPGFIRGTFQLHIRCYTKALM